MRKIFLLILLALLFLSACGAPGAGEGPAPTAAETPVVAETPAPTPVPTPVPTPTPLALPQEHAYVFSYPELGLSFPVSEELAPLLIIRPGVHFFDEGGDSISLYLDIPDGNEAEAGSLARVPRREHFDPTRYYRRYMTAIRVVAASDESLYVDVGTIGGVSGVGDEDIDCYKAAAWLISGDFFVENLTVDNQDGLPVLTPEAVSAEIVALESAPAETMTRAEGAVWAFGLLAADNKEEEYPADNKEEEYPLRFSDVEPGTEAAHAIAYLDSYGMFYGHDGELFRPDEPFTRAEFAELLQRLHLAELQGNPYPGWYGEPIEATDIDEEHWAWDVMNRACKDVWLEMDENGRIRPDEPVTAAEMAHALRAVYSGLVSDDS